jgi:hypothetical protein
MVLGFWCPVILVYLLFISNGIPIFLKKKEEEESVAPQIVIPRQN